MQPSLGEGSKLLPTLSINNYQPDQEAINFALGTEELVRQIEEAWTKAIQTQQQNNNGLFTS